MRPNPESQANGALMRISPLGIFGARYPIEPVGTWAEEDAAITHPHPVCRQANALFAMAIAHGVRSGPSSEDLYREVVAWAGAREIEPSLIDALHDAADAPPSDYTTQMGWVLVAFRNAFWQLLHAKSLEEGSYGQELCMTF